MKTNQEILDIFGEIIIKDTYDFSVSMFSKVLRGYKIWENDIDPLELSNQLSQEDFSILENVQKNISRDSMFNLLKIFEEQQAEIPGRFRLIYEEDGKQVDLVEISEMLKAEPIIENGWIDRFSEYAKISREDKQIN